MRSVLVGVARITLTVEAAVALMLAARFVVGYSESVPRALWLGLFHSVSAFNNAGFALYTDNLMGFVADPWICLPVTVAVIIGGLGFPVVIEVLRQHRRPARWSLHTKITMLMTDYVTKPFAMDKLLARLRAAVRRAAPVDAADDAVVEAGDLTIDLARRRVHRSGAEVRLSPTEWAVLETLVRNRGRMVPRLQLLQEVWGPAYSNETGYLRVYTAQLRRKLEADAAHPRHIITQPGMGYIFET